ncbi:hypothetical protein Tco_0295882 [Tanacetum coccineum]
MMTEMFRLLKELLRLADTPEKVLIEKKQFPSPKYVNSHLSDNKENKRKELPRLRETPDNTEKVPPKQKLECQVRVLRGENENEAENTEVDADQGTSRTNTKFNKLSVWNRVGKKKGKAYKVLPGGPVYDEILKKKITKKEDIEGNFEIPCSIGDLKHANAPLSIKGLM